ncbi:hypothetical protein MHYP_G00345810 [Metynnis hypsauchen]
MARLMLLYLIIAHGFQVIESRVMGNLLGAGPPGEPKVSLLMEFQEGVTGSIKFDCQLLMPFHIYPTTGFSSLPKKPKQHRCQRREISVMGTFDNSVYIEAVGVPRGVPDKVKARNQITAGFESIFLWPTSNENVDWINYLYYNQLRFINHSRDALRTVHEQLQATSLMAWRKRIALDMLLAERGGVCNMFGDICCTFIPNNTSPDDSFTRALHGVEALSKEMHDNAGIENPLTILLESWFGKWSDLASSVLISVAVAAALITICGCCFSLCARGLTLSLIDSAVTKVMIRGPRP